MTAIVMREPELREWRGRLLAEAGIPEALLRERGAAGQEEPGHYDTWMTVRSIDYLLGEHGPHTD